VTDRGGFFCSRVSGWMERYGGGRYDRESPVRIPGHAVPLGSIQFYRLPKWGCRLLGICLFFFFFASACQSLGMQRRRLICASATGTEYRGSPQVMSHTGTSHIGCLPVLGEGVRARLACRCLVCYRRLVARTRQNSGFRRRLGGFCRVQRGLLPTVRMCDAALSVCTSGTWALVHYLP
jgi:hypothetical protein